MFEIEFVSERRITSLEAWTKIRDALVNRKPFSFVRMNDGEAIILGAFKEFAETDVKRITHHWWGRDDYTHEEISDLRRYLLDAAASADILATFDVMDPHRSRWTMAGQLVRRYADLTENQRFSQPDVHYAWQQEDSFVDLFQGLEEVVYISNFNVGDGMKEKFGFKSVHHIPIPPHATAGNVPLEGEAQYPDFFKKTVDELRSSSSGKVVLIGAGVVGKYYCHVVKEAGGIGLDIGSVFDFWAGNRKRRSVRKRASRVGF